MYDLIILGAGPAGLSAGMYAQRAQLQTLLLEKGFAKGGQMMNTHEVDNYLGMPGVTGMELCEAFEAHAEKVGLPSCRGEVQEIRREEGRFLVVTGPETYETRAVLIATGARHRQLEVPGEQELSGMGVSYCATCDGAFFQGQTVAVVGGGDTALEDALFLARSCEKVYVIHRRDTFRGTSVLQEALRGLDNVELLMDSAVEEIRGESRVEGLTVRNLRTGERTSLEVGGVFVAVGNLPNSEPFRGLVEMDGNGYIAAGEDCRTSEPGIFAAGDVRTKPLRQIVTAVADGACAVASVQEYLLGQ